MHTTETPGPDRVVRFAAFDVGLDTRPPAFVAARAGEITANWNRLVADNPKLFNGQVLLFDRPQVTDGVLRSAARPVDFAAFHYWLFDEARDAALSNVFGAIAPLSADGQLILGRMNRGMVGAGDVKLSSGTPDLSDIGSDGRVDLVGSMARELAEETGLDAGLSRAEPGFLMVDCAPFVAVIQVRHFPEPAAELVRQAAAFLAADPDPELAEVLAVATAAEARALGVPPYTQILADRLLPP